MTTDTYVERHTLTPDDLAAMFARDAEREAAKRAARERDADWHGQVEGTLMKLALGIAALRERVDLLESKIEGAER